MRKANLFVVGAMRAGTTSFIDVLSSHPKIFCSPIKEPNYFVESLPNSYYEPSRFFSVTEYFDKKFPESLHIAKIDSLEDYNYLYSPATVDHSYLLDGSSSYLHEPKAVTRIANYNPESSIIILLRDPLERAYSHYKMDIGLSRHNSTFEERIKTEIKQYNAGTLPWHSYIGMSLYTKAVNRYKDFFEEKVLVIRFEELIKNPEDVMLEVTSFLNIDEFSQIDLDSKNKTHQLRYRRLFYNLKKLGLKDYFSHYLGSSAKQWLFQRLIKDAPNGIILSEKLQTAIEKIFKKESVV